MKRENATGKAIMARKNYTIGLDIGTNSVGWAVIDEDFNLVQGKKKITENGKVRKSRVNLWGARLFDAAKTANENNSGRRAKRTTRRRLARRRNRLRYLQAIFAEPMKAVDENFFHRLETSFLNEKKSGFHPLFPTEELEKAYYQKYPTIYHLRHHLMESTEKADLREIYLAIAHIMKARGHFLIEGELSGKNGSVEETFKQFVDSYNQTFAEQADGSLINLVNFDDLSPSDLTEKLSAKVRADKVWNTTDKKQKSFYEFLKLIVGNQGNFKTSFGLEEDAKLQMSKDSYDEDLSTLLAQISDEYVDVFELAHEVYNAVALAGILGKHTTISAAMVARFEKHNRDLQALKRELPVAEYQDFYNDSTKNGYAGYIEGHTTQADFYAEVKKLTHKFDADIDAENFCRKQRTFDNGSIPHQIHQRELEAILENQGQFHPFLKENAGKILQIFKFRIPYYVGPLTDKHSDFAWLTRKSDEAIRPWNLEEVVDIGKSATVFIEKMTNFDTYLPDEKVLPKHSMLYEKYSVYNELTKVQYQDEQGNWQYFSTDEKQKIFEHLFKKSKKVTVKNIQDFVKNELNIEGTTISGLEKSFNASYATYNDFVKLSVPLSALTDAELEDIVKILTVFEDRKMRKQQLLPYKEKLATSFDALVKKHYTGWGRLSERLINGLRDKESRKTILDFLMDDQAAHRNLMQLINDDGLTFKAQIAKAQSVSADESLTEIVQALAGSPAIKKGILQSLKVVDELVKFMGCPPSKIVVEIARENQTTQKGKDRSQARKKQLEEVGVKLSKDFENEKLQNDRLFLYYLQDGKDAYTGDTLDISNLSQYDIDHIIPQAFTTDNSIDNRVLVSQAANRAKGDAIPSMDIGKNRKADWERWRKQGRISERKFLSLTKAERGGLTEDDKAGFIKRQLVETRQITKHVANILDSQFNTQKDENGELIRTTKVITLKSALASQFRKIYGFYKVREINDFHHAHDAYLNAVVANALLKMYPQLEKEFVYGEFRHQGYRNYKSAQKATEKRNFYMNLMKNFEKEKVWDSETGEVYWDKENIATVKRMLSYKPTVVKKVEVQKGQFSKESILPHGESNKLIPRKKNWDTTKYGGFDSPNAAYTVAISYEKGKSKKFMQTLVAITIMECEAFEKEPLKFLEDRGFTNPKLLMKLPKYSLYEFEDGRRRLLVSANEAQKGNQIAFERQLAEFLYAVNHYDKIKNQESGESYGKFVDEHFGLFGKVIAQVADSAERYGLANKKLADKMQEVQENLASYTIDDLRKAVIGFVNITSAGTTNIGSALKAIGGPVKDAARVRYTTAVDTNIFDATLISQSITGLYETRRKL